MRYYDIICGNGWRWTSHPNGVYDPNAQQIEMMLETYVTPDPTSNSTVEIHGVPWEQIRDTSSLIDKTVVIYGGMEKGLPLATYQSRNKGHLVTGRIQKAWGNWVGTNMSIGMQIAVGGIPDGSDSSSGAPSGGTDSSSSSTSAQGVRFSRTGPRGIHRRLPQTAATTVPSVAVTNPTNGGSGSIGGSGSSVSFPNLLGGVLQQYVGGGNPGLTNPLNLIHNLLPNMPLASAMNETLSRAFSGLPLNIQISSMLRLGYQDAAVYQSMNQYIDYINHLSQSILGATQGTKNYLGVRASSDGTSLDIWDGTSNFGNTDITAGDLIGQPTWVDRYLVQIKMAMRGNIKPNMIVTLPTTIFNIDPAAIQLGSSDQRTNLTLGGSYRIYRVRHIGDYRNPDGNNWCTIIDTWPLSITVSDVQAAIYPSSPIPPIDQNLPQDIQQILTNPPPVLQSNSLNPSQARMLLRSPRR